MKDWRTVFVRLRAGKHVVVDAPRNAAFCAAHNLKLRGELPRGFSLHTRTVPNAPGRLELSAGPLLSRWAAALSRLKKAGDRVRVSGRTRILARHALKRHAGTADGDRVRIDEDEGGVWLTLLAPPKPNFARRMRELAVDESVVAMVAAASTMHGTAHRVRRRNPQRRFHTHIDRAARTVRDYATNVLSFPHEPAPGEHSGLLGDLVIGAPVVAREAREQGKTARDHYAHMTIHGVLHLLGYDHEDERDAGRMETLEARILASLGIDDPYR
jgi:rRNA maturation RNase YbeY